MLRLITFVVIPVQNSNQIHKALSLCEHKQSTCSPSHTKAIPKKAIQKPFTGLQKRFKEILVITLFYCYFSAENL